MSYAAGTWVIPMDQEFAETVRQVLDVQQYPDLRESPDGPLEQPYDAAGWTLPFQMGVSVTALTTPITAEFRAQADAPWHGPARRTARSRPTRPGANDTAPFDSAPGVGFDTSSTAAAIVPPPGKITGTGSGAGAGSRRRTTRSRRSIARGGWARG